MPLAPHGDPPPPTRTRANVSRRYGQFDLVGFPKKAAFWYRTQWLLGIPDGSDKPYATNGSYEVRLVESWEPPAGGNSTKDVHAYSNADEIELFANGVSRGRRSLTPMVDGPGSYAEWSAVPWTAGNVTAVAYASDIAVASDARVTNGAAAALALSLDAPSETTGTGSKLLLDGQDAALVRAAVVDASGRVCHACSQNVSFRIVSGPGEVLGAHGGDPRAKLVETSPWHYAYHGLVRCVVRATSTAGREDLELLRAVDGTVAAADDGDIVLEATAPGLAAARLTIPTSTDAADSVLSVAAAAAGKSVDMGF